MMNSFYYSSLGPYPQQIFTQFNQNCTQNGIVYLSAPAIIQQQFTHELPVIGGDFHPQYLGINQQICHDQQMHYAAVPNPNVIAFHPQSYSHVSFNQPSTSSAIYQQIPPAATSNVLPSKQSRLDKTAKHDKNKTLQWQKWVCPECKTRFRQHDAFYAHFERCWVEAVEQEHRLLVLEREILQPSREDDNRTAKAGDRQIDQKAFRNGNNREEPHFNVKPPPMLTSESDRTSKFISTMASTTKKKKKQTPVADDLPENDQISIIGIDGEGIESTPEFQGPNPRVKCPVCNAQLYQHNLKVHMRIHNDELPFACDYCPKRFRTNSALKVHVRTHTGEKPYECKFCAYSCTTKRNLDRHILNKHLR